ncbi:MAG: hypothetical protein QNJ97_20180 [Myxococcota bacterium]|nr:hypothetical protein [Myxococcota bacterium]
MTAQLMYIPLPASVEEQFNTTIREELKSMSINALANAYASAVTDVEKQPTTRGRRIAQYLDTIHGKDELAKMIRRHLSQVADAPSAVESASTESEIRGEQGYVVPLVVLGVAIAVWLIGWAITGECDWYMGMYSG